MFMNRLKWRLTDFREYWIWRTGSFSRTLVDGDGVTAALLKQRGIAVYGESEVAELWK